MFRSRRVGRRPAVALAAALVIAAGPAVLRATAEPIDTWEITNGIDCVGDRFNPVLPDGTRDPEGDPQPGSQEWIERDDERLQCDGQRDADRRAQPAFVNAHSVARYGEDWYRQPLPLDGVRFRYDYVPTGTGLGGVPAMEVYRPCAPDTCPDLPEGLERFSPPYPVVVIHHGFIATMTHHRFNAQTFAEAGYLAIVVNGTHPVPGAPNVQRDVNGGIADDNTSQPIMYQRTDGAFSAPQNTARSGYPEERDRGLETYLTHRERGLDVFHVTFRATNHIDWNGNGVGSLAGNRLAESVINYYSLAWLDRHLQGRLVFDESGAVKTGAGRTEAEERAFRQAQAQEAFDRLTAMTFDDSSDRHNISMGFYDPEQHVASLDPLYGGNVPYSIEGLWVTDRFAHDYRSFCSVSVPDYVGGGDGGTGSPTAARADSGVDGDLRFTGCPSVP